MPFNNPYFAGDGTLVIDQIQSRNFDPSPNSPSGWQLDKDGDATIHGLDVRQINLRVGTLGTANFDLDKWINGMAFTGVKSIAALANYNTTVVFTDITDNVTFPNLSGPFSGGGFNFTGVVYVTVTVSLDLTAAAVPTGLFDCKLEKDGASVGQGLVVDFRDRAAGVRETHTFTYETVSVTVVNNAGQNTLDLSVRHSAGANPYTISTSNSMISVMGSLDMSDFIV